MTIETYNRATDILKEKEQLEKELCHLRASINLTYNMDEYIQVCNKLFQLGQEFNSL